MPMRAVRASQAAYRAGAGHVGLHVSGNLGVWIAVAAAVTAAAGFLNWRAVGREGSAWGHVMAVAGMLLGILVMMWSQVGHVAPDAADLDGDRPDAPAGDGHRP